MGRSLNEVLQPEAETKSDHSQQTSFACIKNN